MKKLFITLISFSALLLSCSKNKTDIATDKVQIRIENATAFTLEDATVGNINYGDVIKGKLTDYKILDQPIYAGYCMFKVDNNESFAGVGVCGTTPLPPPFDPGYYTFKVIPAISGYNTVTVIKN